MTFCCRRRAVVTGSNLGATKATVVRHSFVAAGVGEVSQLAIGDIQLGVQVDGNVVLSKGKDVLWATNTASQAGAPVKLVLQGDGNLVLYINNKPSWDAKTSDATKLVLQDDQNLVLLNAGGKPVWASNTAGVVSSYGATSYSTSYSATSVSGDAAYVSSGWGLVKRLANGPHTLEFQGDGNLVLYNKGKFTGKASHTQGPGSKAIMQDDGNLVVYDGGHVPRWVSGTHAGAGRVGLVSGRTRVELRLLSNGQVKIFVAGKESWTM